MVDRYCPSNSLIVGRHCPSHILMVDRYRPSNSLFVGRHCPSDILMIDRYYPTNIYILEFIVGKLQEHWPQQRLQIVLR